MVLFHEPVQIVDETIPGVFSVLEVHAHVNGFHRANFLTHSAEDAPELVDLVDDGISIALIVFSTYKADTIGRTHHRGDSSGLSSGYWSVTLFGLTRCLKVRAIPLRVARRYDVLTASGRRTTFTVGGIPFSSFCSSISGDARQGFPLR